MQKGHLERWPFLLYNKILIQDRFSIGKGMHMIKFRNPGLYKTQVQIFKELYKEYKDVPHFSLDDMKNTIAKTRLMTAYGYSGDTALALSNTKNDSLNSTKMNQKMYAEVFRMLGWITSAGKSSYPLVFTYLGEHIAEAEDTLPLYEQCALGINNPQEIIDVDYMEEVRFFKTALSTFTDLNGIMYKHELCMGPMSVNDTEHKDYKRMIASLQSIRGSYSRYEKAFGNLCHTLGMKYDSVDNSTRLPIDCMKACGWVESEYSREIYPPRSLKCLRLTEYGKRVATDVRGFKDLRLNEFKKYPKDKQQSLIRIGFYSMMKRAGYDISSVSDMVAHDMECCASILQGKELLFSPYQTLAGAVVDEALGLNSRSGEGVIRKEQITTISRTEAVISNISLICDLGGTYILQDDETVTFFNRVIQLKRDGSQRNEIVDLCFREMEHATEPTFYPFVAMLFRIMGLNCHASRTGDNGARWDLIIEDSVESIPVEVKSPTEVLHLSLKAIRQALENKIILLSRREYPTLPDTTSLAVCYYLPKDRAESTNLINDIHIAYGVNIGIVDFHTLLTIAVTIIYDKKTFDISELNRLEGFANATFN